MKKNITLLFILINSFTYGQFGSSGSMFLPDGSGLNHYDTLQVTGFPVAQTITSASDIDSLTVNIEHSWLGDLEVLLECPNGTQVVIFDSYDGATGMISGGFNGGGTFLGNPLDDPSILPGIGSQYTWSNSNAIWGDFATEFVGGNTIPATQTAGNSMNPNGVYLPEETFASFIGCPVNGAWTIIVRDNIAADNGYIFEWGLYYNSAVSCPLTLGIDTRSACDSLVWLDGITYLANNNTVTYTMLGGNSNGCDSLITLDLTINSLSSNYTYLDNGNGNYSFTNITTGIFNESHWAFGDGNTSGSNNSNHTFSSNGVYSVILTVNDSSFGGGCFDYYIDTLNVTGVPSPTQCNAGFVMYPDTGINNVTVVNSSTGGNLTYLWDFGDGNTSTLQNPSHTYATAGLFYLCLTVDDGAGCVDQYCDSIGANGVVFKTGGFTINVIGTPIITRLDNNVDLSSEVNIYPNPTSHQLSIDTGLELREITIIDITGKAIMTTKQNTNIVNTADLSNGIYFIQLITDERTITKKFVKQ